MRLPPAAVERLLDTWPVARLATLAPDGAPHQVPVVFARHDDTLYTPIDGKPKSARVLARVRNVERDRRVSLLLDDYGDDWSRLWWLRVDGEARVVRLPDASARSAVTLLERKYPQYRDVPVLRADATLIAIRPLRITSWEAGGGGGR